jgi:uncharacterized protein
VKELNAESAVELDMTQIYKYIIEDLSLDLTAVMNTVSLLEAKATVPFIARYRKERTGGLDENQIRDIQEKWEYYCSLEKRKAFICASISDQEKMTDVLRDKIVKCREKRALEDIYLPYKPKKRTKATIAKERGLEPLSDLIWKQETIAGDYEATVGSFIDNEKEILTTQDAISGAVDIIVERINDDADIRGRLRNLLESNGALATKVRKDWRDKKTKYEMYYDFSEPIKRSPSHRLLAIRRGANEGVIGWGIEVDDERAVTFIENKIVVNKRSIFTDDLIKACHNAYKRMLTSLEVEVFIAMMQHAEDEAINVFSKNLKTLLLEAPAGGKCIMGIDPGFRTGCKVAIIDDCGSFMEYKAIFPHPPQRKEEEAAHIIKAFLEKYDVELIAIGNGTASRETAAFIHNIIPKESRITVVVVSEAGASVYSASPAASQEFPDLDITIRGAISIARRLQDPLAELVKIDPKAIGVGQYQHDVNQPKLKKALDSVVESCVNYVGVELNTASRELLSYVSGIGPALAQNIVDYRKTNGLFNSRAELLKVSKLGDKAYEQCAGFLRVRASANRLDNSAIHPERYSIVEQMAADISCNIESIVGDKNIIEKIDIKKYVTADVGKPTLKDIISELLKPGLDPRAEFHNIEFRSDIQEIKDLTENMELVGKVTNVTNFGAFVDIGVHQDGLVHISKLSNRFVKDPYDIVSVGDKIKVRVLSVDTELKRIGLERIEK